MRQGSSGGAGAVRARRLVARAMMAAVFGAATTLGACASAGPAAPPPRPVPVVQLSSTDVQAVAALLRLEDRRELDSAAIAGFARSTTPEVRRRAYLAAGRIGGPGAAALVRPGLDDAAAPVRAAAAFALGLLRDTVSLDSLARVALQDAPQPAARAVFALGRIGGQAAARALLGILAPERMADSTARRVARRRISADTLRRSAPPAPAVVGQALLTIWRLARQPAFARAVEPYAASRDTALRWRAAYALMRLGDPAAVSTLLHLLSDSLPEVRALAARGLRAAVADSAGRRAAALHALTRALRDPAPHVRITAAGALAGYHDPALVPAIAALLHDPDTNVAIAGAQALGSLGQSAGASPLRALLDGATGPLALRAAALASLARLDPSGGTAVAARWAADSAAAAWRRRYFAASALASARWNFAAGPLQALARDPDPRVASAAIDAMTALLGDSLPAPRPLLVEQLGASDPIRRAAAIRALSASPQPADLGLYLDSYARAAGDTLDDAALAAVDALAALRRKGAPAASSFFARFRRSPDFIVRLAVARKLGSAWGPPGPVDTGRDSAFYLDVVRSLVAPVLAGGPAPRVRILTEVGIPPHPGVIVLELDAAGTPLTVANFLRLARMHYFDGDRWHRVVPDFVAQDGDPRGDGNGGPGWAIRDELNPRPYLRGSLGMALAGPDTGGSQFFLALSPQPHLDAGYTLFGRVVEGFDVLDSVVQDDVIRAVEVMP